MSLTPDIRLLMATYGVSPAARGGPVRGAGVGRNIATLQHILNNSENTSVKFMKSMYETSTFSLAEINKNTVKHISLILS